LGLVYQAFGSPSLPAIVAWPIIPMAL